MLTKEQIFEQAHDYEYIKKVNLKEFYNTLTKFKTQFVYKIPPPYKNSIVIAIKLKRYRKLSKYSTNIYQHKNLSSLSTINLIFGKIIPKVIMQRVIGIYIHKQKSRLN